MKLSFLGALPLQRQFSSYQPQSRSNGESAMRLTIRMLLSFVATLVLGTSALGAQTMTTGTLVGTVMDEQGAVLPGADVVAVHEPTGTTYETVTASDGRYQLLNVRVGGPYKVTARLSGFREQTQPVVGVALGEAASTDFKLRLENLQETVTVTAETPLIDSTRPARRPTSPKTRSRTFRPFSAASPTSPARRPLSISIPPVRTPMAASAWPGATFATTACRSMVP